MAIGTCTKCKRSFNTKECPKCGISMAFDEIFPMEDFEEVKEEAPKETYREMLLREGEENATKPLNPAELNKIREKLEWIIVEMRRAPNCVDVKQTLGGVRDSLQTKMIYQLIYSKKEQL